MLRVVKVEGNLVTLSDGTTINQDELPVGEAFRDSQRLNFVQSQGTDPQGNSITWIARPSGTGRGYRIYTGSTRQPEHESVREAIDYDMQLAAEGSSDRQRLPW